MATGNFVYTQTTTTNRYGSSSSDNSAETYRLFGTMAHAWNNTLTNIIAKYPNEQKIQIAYVYDLKAKIAITWGNNEQLGMCSEGLKWFWYDLLEEDAKKHKEIDPNFDAEPFLKLKAAFDAQAEAQAKQSKISWAIAWTIVAATFIGLIVFIVSLF